MNIDKSRKKINVVSQFWPPNFVGGGEISTYIVCQELAKRGYEITILTPNIPKQKDNYFNFIKLNNPRFFLSPFEKKYFSTISFKVELPIGVYWASDFYGAAFLYNKDVKKIVTVRDHWPTYKSSRSILKCNEIIDANIQKKITRIFRYLYNRKFRKSILQQFNHSVFVSNYIANKITLTIPLKNYSVIYNPLSSEFMKKESLKKSINKNIIYSGRISEYKGIDILLKALQVLVRYDRNFNLVIIGEGDLDKYKNIVNELSISRNVNFVGKINNEETVKYYDSSTFVVIPSMWLEPFGRTVIEGMARKCIAIATNRGGPAEIIKNGENGFLFEKGNYKQLAEIIVNLYHDPKTIKKIQDEAREFAINNFSPDKIINQYELILKNLF